MKCNACASPNPDSHKFCECCGGALAQRCASCGVVCGPTAKFCGGCGRALNGPHAESVALQTNWGELKPATILFADIVRSTEHIADLDPEQVMAQLRPAVVQMCNAVESFGGTVIRTLGDGVMAIFGVPHALEGHARLACESALAMQDSFAQNPQGLRIRVGLHSGQVALDPRAADALIGGGLYGHSIHLASRVVALAEPGGVCITAACLALIRSAGAVAPMGPHQLKGIPEAVELFVLTAMHNEIEAVHFHHVKLSPLRGRAQELSTLQNALHQAVLGHGSVVGLCGMPGMGKSRLCFEFAQWCRSQNADVYEVRTHPYGYATPLQPVLALLRTCFFHIPEGDAPAVTRQRIAQRLATLVPQGDVKVDVDVDADAALFESFFGVADPERPASTLSSGARQSRLLALLGDLARDTGRNAPDRTTTVIMLEDLHWLDEASLAFLTVLVQSVVGVRLVLLLTYRPTFAPSWAALPQFRAVTLDELAAYDIADLVHQRLRHRPDLAEAAALMVERAAGNPFFAEELVQSLLEASARSVCVDRSPPSALQIAQALPVTVQAVIGERIDRLVATQKSLLHICAVIGKEIPLPVLQQVAVYLSKQIDTGLDGLCKAELLHLLRAIAADRRFAFRHPLIQEVAYNTQLKARRADLHAAVAVAMEAYYRGQADEYAALIAFHYEAAGELVNAARCEARAAQWVSTTNSAQGMLRWRKVRSLLEGQTPSAQVNNLKALACGRIVYLGWREGLPRHEGQALVTDAIELATESDARLVPLLLFAQGRMVQSSGGAADHYVSNVQQALALPIVQGDLGRTATFQLALSHAHGWTGLLREGLAANDIAQRDLAQIGAFEREFIGFSLEQWVISTRVRLLNRMGRFDEAKACLVHRASDFTATADPVMRQIAHWIYVDLAWCARDAALARVHMPVVHRIAQENQSPYVQVVASYSEGLVHLITNEFESGKMAFVNTIELIRRTNAGVDMEVDAMAGMAECHHHLGEATQALSMAQETVSLAKHRSNRLAQCRGLIVWGAECVARNDAGDAEQAESLFAQAEQLIVQTGACIFEVALARARTALKG